MCTDELLWLMTQLIDELLRFVEHKDGMHLPTLDTIIDEVQYLLDTEGRECLHTDETIKRLTEFFETLSNALHTLYDHRAWDEIVNLGAATMALRDELGDELARMVAN